MKRRAKRCFALLLSCVFFISLLSCGRYDEDKARLSEFFQLLYDRPNETIDEFIEAAVLAPASETPREALTREQPAYDMFGPYIAIEYMDTFLQNKVLGYADYEFLSAFTALELEEQPKDSESLVKYSFTVMTEATDLNGDAQNVEIGGTLWLNDDGKVTRLYYDNSYAAEYVSLFPKQEDSTTYKLRIVTPPLQGFIFTAELKGDNLSEDILFESLRNELRKNLYSQYLAGSLDYALRGEEYEKEFFDNLEIEVTAE